MHFHTFYNSLHAIISVQNAPHLHNLQSGFTFKTEVRSCLCSQAYKFIRKSWKSLLLAPDYPRIFFIALNNSQFNISLLYQPTIITVMPVTNHNKTQWLKATIVILIHGSDD